MAKKKKSKEKKLDPTLEDFLKPLEDPIKKEVKFLENNDWTTDKNRGKRKSALEVHTMITDRALNNAGSLYKLSKGDLDHPRLKSIFEIYSKIYKLFEGRYYSYVEKEDWTTYEDGKEVTDELELQSDARKSLTKFSSVMRDINFGDEVNSHNVHTFNNTPIPLMMKELVEERWPEIKDYLEKRKEE